MQKNAKVMIAPTKIRINPEYKKPRETLPGLFMS